MVILFASGSCRLLTTIGDGSGDKSSQDKSSQDKSSQDKSRQDVTSIHSMCRNFIGPHFLGKLHNTKQHIQFLRFIHDEIDVPDDIVSDWLTSYSHSELVTSGAAGQAVDKSLLPMYKAQIKAQWTECDWFLFEICSLKLYQRNGWQVQHELTAHYDPITIQSEQDLMDDLQTIRDMIPAHQRILFQVHFRPNVIFQDASLAIEPREIIYRVVQSFCKERLCEERLCKEQQEHEENTFLYDPSILLQTDHSLFDGDVHFTPQGHAASFQHICQHFLLLL